MATLMEHTSEKEIRQQQDIHNDEEIEMIDLFRLKSIQLK